MNRNHENLTARARAVFTAALLVGAAFLTFTPVVPGAQAVDPTPDPLTSASPAASDPAVAPSVAPDPSLAPDPSVAPDPSLAPDPSVAPDPSLAPDPSAVPSPDPSANPSPEPSVDPGTSPAPSASPEPSASPAPSASPEPSATPRATGLRVDHAWVDVVGDTGTAGHASGVDVPATGIERFQLYRVRFQVANDSDVAITLHPLAQVSPTRSGATFRALPEADPRTGVPFYSAADEGRSYDARSTGIAIGALRLDAGEEVGATAAAGISMAGENPGAGLRSRPTPSRRSRSPCGRRSTPPG